MSEMLQWKLKGTSSAFSTSRLVHLPCTVRIAREKLKEECGLQNVTAIDFVLYLPSNEPEVLPDSYSLGEQCQVLVARCPAAEARKLLEAAEKRFAVPGIAASTSKSESNTGSISRIATTVSMAQSSSATISSRPSMESQTQESNAESLNGETVEDRKLTAFVGGSPTITRQRTAGEFDDATTHSSLSEPSLLNGGASSVNAESAIDSDDEDSRIRAAMQERDFYGGESTEAVSRRYYRHRTLAAPGAPVTGGAPRGVRRLSHSHASYSTPGHRFDHGAAEVIPVAENYVCHLCGQRGHHIRNCTQSDGKKPHKKVRLATGIPVDFLQVIGEDEIGNYGEVYLLRTGEFAVMKDMSRVSGGAFFTKSADQRIQSQLGLSEAESKNMVRSLRCSICNNFFNNPVAVLCCGVSFCLECVVDRAGGRAKIDLSRIYHCPRCQSELHFSDLQANTALKNAVDDLVLRKSGEPKSRDTPVTAKRSATRAEVKGKDLVDVSFLKKQKTLASEYLTKLRQ
ncbi:zinc C3HC4 type protein [Babesia ovata]|uniref:Zinc C3HC4 type protein n=1 Tax=Babesia ovata TaxID=189622 RepID=A0A2H6K7N5_9APIC|nr:zinc C3HC4 type protein [Babesia ovata]GBE59000.1 zinc C3HC4 type protein [Babesia ovata]